MVMEKMRRIKMMIIQKMRRMSDDNGEDEEDKVDDNEL